MSRATPQVTVSQDCGGARIFVLESTTPVLLSVEALRDLGAIVCFDKQQCCRKIIPTKLRR